jgi:hypothetical protein
VKSASCKGGGFFVRKKERLDLLSMYRASRQPLIIHPTADPTSICPASNRPANASACYKKPVSSGGFFLKGEKKEIWMQLCERAASEQDPDKLMELVKEINRLLEEKERRLKHTSKHP